MPSSGLTAIDRAVNTTNAWLSDLAKAFGHEDRRFAYRVLRGWLHAVRDRLPVTGSAHFTAQLPELVRGMYYDGWDPSHVPTKFGADEFRRRLAEDAQIGVDEVAAVSRTTASVLAEHLSPGTLDTVFRQLPHGVRELTDPTVPAPSGNDGHIPTRGAPGASSAVAADAARAAAAPGRAGGTQPSAGSRLQSLEQRLSQLEQTVARGEKTVEVLHDSLRTLSSGLAEAPSAETTDPAERARVARLAHELLLTAPDRAAH